MEEPKVSEGTQQNPETGKTEPENKTVTTPETPKGDGSKEYTDAEKAAFARFQKEKEKATDALTRLEALEKEKAATEEQKAIEAGDFQKVIDNLKAENAELSQYKTKVDYSGEVINSYLEKEMEAIPEEMRGLIPDKLSAEDKLKYISDNSHILKKNSEQPVVPTATGGGNLPKNNNTPVVGEEEAMQKRYNEIMEMSRSGAFIPSSTQKEMMDLGRKLKELRTKE